MMNTCFSAAAECSCLRVTLCICGSCSGVAYCGSSENGLLAVISLSLNAEHSNDKNNRFITVVISSQKNLRLHEALHATDSLVCPECEKTFRRMASFKAHLAVHEEDESVTCEICHEEFISLVGAAAGEGGLLKIAYMSFMFAPQDFSF